MLDKIKNLWAKTLDENSRFIILSNSSVRGLISFFGSTAGQQGSQWICFRASVDGYPVWQGGITTAFRVYVRSLSHP
jgi:hypothetical protein